MTWVPGKSGNPQGRRPGQIKKATKEVIKKLTGRDLAPGDMAAAMLRRLFDISADPATPISVQVQAIGTALPYLAPRLSVTAQTVTHRYDYSDCRTKEELLERVDADLGEYWSTLFRKAMQSGDPEAVVIDAEVIPQPTAASEQRPKPESAG
jgi:hypothetical protein